MVDETAEGVPARTPTFHAFSFGVAAGPAGVSLVAQTQIPLVATSGVTGVIVEPVATLQMSMHATKQLVDMLSRVVADFESQFGVLQMDPKA